MHRHFIILAVMLCSLLAGPAAYGNEVVDRIVAVVDGDAITLFEVDKMAVPYVAKINAEPSIVDKQAAIDQIRQEVLNKMINDKLLNKEVERYQLTVSDADVQNYIREFREKNNMTEEMLTRQLMFEGITRQEYEDKIRENILHRRLLQFKVTQKILVSEEEVRAYYDAHLDEFTGLQAVDLQLILLEPGKDAEALKKQIQDGKITFEDAAAKHSVGPGADKGGEFGTFRQGEMSPQLAELVKDKQEGDIIGPIDLDGKPALLKIRSLSSVDGGTYDDVHDKVFAIVNNQKVEERLAEYLESLRNKAIIDIRL